MSSYFLHLLLAFAICEQFIATTATVLRNAEQWRDGVIPYQIEDTHDEEITERIRLAFDAFEYETCLKFVPRTNEDDYISISTRLEGCYAIHGKKETGPSVVNLQRECTTRIGQIMHEVMHTLGFEHENNRWDRDQYVDVKYENIFDDKKIDFDKFGADELNTFNMPYDYDSVMHFGHKAFSLSGNPTIVPKDSKYNIEDLGQRHYFSSADIKKINLLYNCPPKIHIKRT